MLDAIYMVSKTLKKDFHNRRPKEAYLIKKRILHLNEKQCLEFFSSLSFNLNIKRLFAIKHHYLRQQAQPSPQPLSLPLLSAVTKVISVFVNSSL